MRPTETLLEKTRSKLRESRYLRDVLMQASGNSVAQVIGIAAMPVLTRLYAPSDFAVLNLFSQTVAALAILMTLRLEYLVMLPVEQREANGVLRLTFVMGGLHVLWLTPLLAWLPERWSWLHSQGVIARWLWLAPFSSWVISLAVGVQQSNQRHGDFRASAGSELIGRMAYLASALLGVLWLPNLAGLMASTAFNASAKLGWYMYARGKWARTVFQTKSEPISSAIRRMACATSASNVISLASGVAPMIFIADKYGANALGQYGLVVSTLYLPSTLIGQAIGQVYYQRACQLHGNGKSFAALLVTTSLNLARLGLPLYALVAIFAPLAYPMIFGSNWSNAGEMARWLCLSAAAGFLSTPMDRTSMVVGIWWYLSAWHSLRAISTISCLAWVQMQDLPIESCVLLLAIQTAVAYGLDWFASYRFAHRSKRGLSVPASVKGGVK